MSDAEAQVYNVRAEAQLYNVRAGRPEDADMQGEFTEEEKAAIDKHSVHAAAAVRALLKPTAAPGWCTFRVRVWGNAPCPWWDYEVQAPTDTAAMREGMRRFRVQEDLFDPA